MSKSNNLLTIRGAQKKKKWRRGSQIIDEERKATQEARIKEPEKHLHPVMRYSWEIELETKIRPDCYEQFTEEFEILHTELIQSSLSYNSVFERAVIQTYVCCLQLKMWRQCHLI